MNVNEAEQSSEHAWQADFWTVSKWFILLIIMFVVWIALYLFAHSANGIAGYEYTGFNNAQIRQVNRILSAEGITGIQAMPPQEPVQNSGALIDSTASITVQPSVEMNNMSTLVGCDMGCRIDKAIVYVNSEFDNNLTAVQLKNIRQYMNTFGPQDVGIFLADYRLKVKSYFWLEGPMLYAEVVCWVIAGVICSLIFTAGLAFRNSHKDNYNNKEVLYQVAKIFYAPFITLIIILAYNYFKHNTTLSANLGQGVLVFAFIAGFYSGRFMNFLNNLKHLILPGQENNYETVRTVYTDNNYSSNAMAAPATQAMQAPYVAEPRYESPAQEQLTVDENGALNEKIRKQRQVDEGLIDVEIEVKLDGTSLFDEEREDLQRKGFSKTIVTLHNVNGKDIIPAKRTLEKNGAIFLATGVKPGIYIARATLSQRLNDDQVVNLFGERTSYITLDKPGLELFIRKYELAD